MKQIADLYVRVSTDEQADKGYSQRNQEEVLKKYCQINNIALRDIIYEDHSAKTFLRPKWKLLLVNLKKFKNKTDLVLFTKWDRFSRNAGDAYQMINTLRKLGVEPQAIEQPLDLSVPENKMMLAFYLAVPEVENDRRALNVFHGMRRAKKEGRYVSQAPIGYVNKSKDDGSKYIAIKEPEASIMRWAFNEISKGIFSTEDIHRMARKKGIKTGKHSFWLAVRNPLYCGKIKVPQYKDEPSYLADGQHEAIITEELFYKVQDVVDGRKKVIRPKVDTILELPLRGFLICPVCGKILSGSKSKGRNKYYAYYHCFKGCSHRIGAEEVNDMFIKELLQYAPKREFKKVYSILIMEAYKEQTKERQNEKTRLLNQIKDYENRLSKARDMLMTNQIDALDYREIKSDYGDTLARLQAKYSGLNTDHENIEILLNKGIENLLRIHSIYDNSQFVECRDLIGSIFPENLIFDGIGFRTTRVNEAVQLMYLINKQLDQNKKETNQNISNLSLMVGDEGFEPPTPSV
ncbi:recombinase family protein [Flavobacterium sp. Root420]|uniref:recombinase family protein n=1 Tax=Flavobacterium sp. Root420 TaxID=1736533 RepID=UPI0009ECB709|nr:recombinase family protein [Flavobacterium sp. Root420]